MFYAGTTLLHRDTAKKASVVVSVGACLFYRDVEAPTTSMATCSPQLSLLDLVCIDIRATVIQSSGSRGSMILRAGSRLALGERNVGAVLTREQKVHRDWLEGMATIVFAT